MSLPVLLLGALVLMVRAGLRSSSGVETSESTTARVCCTARGLGGREDGGFGKVDVFGGFEWVGGGGDGEVARDGVEGLQDEGGAGLAAAFSGWKGVRN
ncbi:hypothetical protein BJ508DRAFT_414844 [Ascobolus immersus RN42]|uniref:Secreted protein n=1 Tax=Ascobolus immersus RN42 TaxID=1160509 RepID=A0A3N4I5T3_ASCIM|nr:hypothetical protein BJ508DRAFT_414844 [Ascobolus immersus RN42]